MNPLKLHKTGGILHNSMASLLLKEAVIGIALVVVALMFMGAVDMDKTRQQGCYRHSNS